VKVWIKDFAVDMELKNTGIELDVADPQGNHLGDLIVTKTQLIWCQGRTRRENGKKIDWGEFIALMNER
jgi:hypothetical protein